MQFFLLYNIHIKQISQKIIYFFTFIISINLIYTQTTNYDTRANTPVPYTLADRDRLIKLEVEQTQIKNEIKEIKQEMQDLRKEMQGLRQEMQDLRKEMQEIRRELINITISLFSISITLILALFGFIIWDRRTFMRPIERKVTILEQEVLNYKEDKTKFEQLQQLLSVFKELAKTDENVAKVLKQFNLF